MILQFAKQIQYLWKHARQSQINFAAAKSVVLASSVALKKQLPRLLKCMGTTLASGSEARYLGADRALGARTTNTQQK